jgi:SprT protein
MPELIHSRVETCYLQAEAFFQQSFPRPQVSFKLRGQKAGVAHPTENKLRFNPQLYRENQQDFLRQTVAHEVAHLVAYQRFGSGIPPHGEEWRLIMRGIYHLPPERCHSYAIERPQGNRFVYRCQCPQGEFLFSAQRHARVVKGQRYLCKRCRGVLHFSGEQRRG